MQISGIIIWPVMNMGWEDDSLANPEKSYWVLQSSWALPLGLFLTSFGWWESFVEEESILGKIFYKI